MSRVKLIVLPSKTGSFCRVRSCFEKAFRWGFCEVHYAEFSRVRGARECQLCGLVFESVYDGDKQGCRVGAGGLHSWKQVGKR